MRKFRRITMFGVLVVCATLLNLMAGFSDRTGKPYPPLLLTSTIASTKDLTAEQRKQIRRISVSFQNEVAPIVSQKYEKEKALWFLWKQTRPDQQKIKALRMEIHALTWQFVEKYTDYHLAIGNILIAEQLPSYATIPYDRKNGFRK